MKKLSHVSFAHPIPIPGTHLRLADFAAMDGWVLSDEDGCITLAKGKLRFYTYVSASCVEDVEPEPPVYVAGPCAVGCAVCRNPQHEPASVASQRAQNNATKKKR